MRNHDFSGACPRPRPRPRPQLNKILRPRPSADASACASASAHRCSRHPPSLLCGSITLSKFSIDPIFHAGDITIL